MVAYTVYECAILFNAVHGCLDGRRTQHTLQPPNPGGAAACARCADSPGCYGHIAMHMIITCYDDNSSTASGPGMADIMQSIYFVTVPGQEVGPYCLQLLSLPHPPIRCALQERLRMESDYVCAGPLWRSPGAQAGGLARPGLAQLRPVQGLTRVDQGLTWARLGQSQLHVLRLARPSKAWSRTSRPLSRRAVGCSPCPALS